MKVGPRLVVLGTALVSLFVLAGPALGAQENVSIVDNEFQPSNITINVGDTVVWSQNGQNPHTVTADDGAFDSGTLEPGATYSQTFDSTGTFPYFCELHGAAGGVGMSGTVTVRSGGDQPGPSPTATRSPLPRTGAGSAMVTFLWVGAVLLLAGGGVLYAMRRRSRS